jgi:DNA damage-binding protein 1
MATAPSRDLEAAKEAYATGDVEASKLAHATRAPEKHSKVGGHLKSIVYGGLDGIITTFSVVAGSAGGNLDIEVVLILGISNVFSDGLSMGVGDTLSTKAANQYALEERAREMWEMENNPEGEIQEMIEIFEGKGLPKEDAVSAITTMAKNKEFFVDLMMAFELELEVPNEDDNPYIDGLVTFCSFVTFGFVPLLGYIILYSIDLGENKDTTLFILACVLTGIMLFVLGALKTMFTVQKWYCGGMEILVFGAATAATAFVIGLVVEAITGVGE